MINVKVTFKNKTEDYIAVECETGAFVLPGAHVFGIFCIGIISILLALPFGQLVPENYSPFSALTASRNLKNSQYEKEYIKNNEKIVEENIEIASTAGSQENYDDEIVIPQDILANGATYDGQPQVVKESEEASNREKFTSSSVVAQNQTPDTSAVPHAEAQTANSEMNTMTPAEKFISSLITPSSTPAMITQNSDEIIEQNRDENKINAVWYEQTIKRGDSLSKIFNYLNLDKESLKKIIARADPDDLNLIVGEKIQFLVDDNNTILEIAIPINNNKQARFSLDPVKNTYVMAHEQRNAQFNDIEQKLLNANMLPSFIEMEKERQRKDKEKAMLAKREAELKEKEAKERKELARLEAQKREKEKQELLTANKKEKLDHFSPSNRPRLVIGTIGSRENFDRAARRMGLSNAEIATIKSQYAGKVNVLLPFFNAAAASIELFLYICAAKTDMVMAFLSRIFSFFPFTTLCLVLIIVLSFFSPPHTPLDNVAMIDKWTHLVMYGGTVGVFWLEYWRAHYRRGFFLGAAALALFAFVVPVALGGVIELLQAYCTGGRRSGEWLDFLADSLGVVLACLGGLTIIKSLARRLWARDHEG